jgi:YVTN family beta-propeller protein
MALGELQCCVEDAMYVAASDGNVSAIDLQNNTKVKTIPVFFPASAIGFDDNTTKIYVANMDDNTVSGKNNTVIGEPIPVGQGPIAIGVDGYTIPSTIYVANFKDNTVSVIDGKNNANIGTISVGKNPSAIAVDPYTNTIYVANSGSNTVSVIDVKNNTNIGNIPVGASPRAISFNPLTNTIYVANSLDGTVSVIDSDANKVVAKVMFNTKPFDAGHIECDKLIAPVEKSFYIYSGSECTAKPYPGFGFISWQENLGGNATQVIKLLPPPSISDSILDFFHMNSDKQEATLNIT